MTSFFLQIYHGLRVKSKSLTMKKIIRIHRNFSTSHKVFGFKDKFVMEKDWNKRPSDVEIRKKGLPQNTPTLAERIRRDTGSQFLEQDKKSGYHKGETGGLRDYIDPNMTTKEMVAEGFKELKEQIVKWKSEQTREDFDKLPDFGELRTEWTFDTEER